LAPAALVVAVVPAPPPLPTPKLSFSVLSPEVDLDQRLGVEAIEAILLLLGLLEVEPELDKSSRKAGLEVPRETRPQDRSFRQLLPVGSDFLDDARRC
jgi:hypothetical protein